MKKSIYSFLLCALIFTSCSLTATQESSLNQAVSKYIVARNECQLVGLVGFTYPELVREFKQLGDSLFLQKFDCTQNKSYHTKLQNPTLRTVEKEGSTMQVLYEFDSYDVENEARAKQKYKLVAISNNEGLNWFFMPWEDYSDTNSCKSLKRLLK